MDNNDQLDRFSEQARFRWGWYMDNLIDKNMGSSDKIIINETNESVLSEKEVSLRGLIKYFLGGLIFGSVVGYLIMEIYYG